MALQQGTATGGDHEPDSQNSDPFFLAKLLLNVSSCFVFLYSPGLEFSFLLPLLLNTRTTRMSLDNDACLKFGVLNLSMK